MGKDQGYISPRIQLDVSLLSGIHEICIPTFPFDPPTQSDTFPIIHLSMVEWQVLIPVFTNLIAWLESFTFI